MNRIDRSNPYWRQLFFEAWRQLLSHVPSTEVILSAALAEKASALADDAMREALSLDKPAVCGACAGIGCERCKFTGRDAPVIVQTVGVDPDVVLLDPPPQ